MVRMEAKQAGWTAPGSRTKCYFDPAGRECSECGEYKLWSSYGRHKSGLNASQSKCKDCVNEYYRQQRLANGQTKFLRSGPNKPKNKPTKMGYVITTKNGRRRGDHQWAMIRKLGRELEQWEEVHHKNGIRSDNSFENLELWAVPQPKGQRVEDLVRWAVECYPELVNDLMFGEGI